MAKSRILNKSEKYNKPLEQLTKDQADKLKLFSEIVEKSPDGIQIVDLNGHIMYSNNVAEEMFGFPDKDLKGKHVNELNVDSNFANKTIIPTLKKTGKWKGELIVKHKEGRTFTIWLVAFLVNDNNGHPMYMIGISRDLTERKKTEKSLNHIFNLSLDMICIAGFDYYFKSLNPSFEKILGYTQDELFSKPFIEFVHPGDRDATIAEMQKLSSGISTIHFENRYHCKDGSYKWLLWTAKPVIEEKLIYAVAHDITKRKKVEEALKKAEVNLRTIYNAISGHLTVIDANYRIVSYNKTVEKQFGKNLQGRLCYEAYQSRNKICQGCAVKKTIKTKKPAFTFQPATSISKPVEIYTYPIFDEKGELVSVVEHGIEVTERVKIAEALQRSEEKFGNLFQHSNEAIFIHDVNGNITDVNKKSLEKFGYAKSEILSLKISDIHPSKELKARQEVFKRILKDRFIKSETVFKKKNGNVFPAEVSSSLFEIGGKKFIQGIVRDITERKQTEIILIKHQEKLEAQVKERTQDLMEANKNLKIEVAVRKNAEKKLLDYQKQLQSLASQLSLIEEREKRRIATELHDCIGQPLALSKIKLRLLNKTVPSNESKNIIMEILDLIEQTIRDTRTLTFELSPPILYELGLSQAIKWLIDQFHGKHGLKIVFEDDGHDKPFDYNTRFFLFQAVRELLVNIVKHADASKAKIKMLNDNGKLTITVEDNGVGFSKPSLTFNGYGLFNIRERMDHINGSFEIRSKPNRGTQVILAAPFKISKKYRKKELT